MSKNNVRLFICLGILFLPVLLMYKIPHDSYSMIQYIIKPIRNGGSVFYPSSIILLVLFMIGIIDFINLEKFANKSKLLLFLAVVIVILPLMKWSLDFTRTNYYWATQERLGAVDIEAPNINLYTVNGESFIVMNLNLRDYSRETNEFKFRVYLPEALREYSGIEVYESQNSYTTFGDRKVLKVEETIVIDLNHVSTKMLDTKWYYEDVIYELYNENEVVKNIDHGF